LVPVGCCGADDGQALKPLCRHITRPALTSEREHCNAAGQGELRLQMPLRDGTTHLLMSTLEFMPPHVGWPLCAGPIRGF